MKIFLASDHAGFELKNFIAQKLRGTYEVLDCGPEAKKEYDDAADYMIKMAHAMKSEPHSLGIAICRTGGAMTIIANRFSHIRAVAGQDKRQIISDCHDDHINVLVLGSEHVEQDEVLENIETFIHSPRSDEERFLRRLEKSKRLGD